MAKEFYILVGFPAPKFEADLWLADNCDKAIKAKEENNEKELERLRKERKKYIKENGHNVWCNCVNLMYAETEDVLINAIEEHGDSLCEGYYRLLMIEKHFMNTSHPTDEWWNQNANDIWYDWKLDEDGYFSHYERIERPDCYKQICGFGD